MKSFKRIIAIMLSVILAFFVAIFVGSHKIKGDGPSLTVSNGAVTASIGEDMYSYVGADIKIQVNSGDRIFGNAYTGGKIIEKTHDSGELMYFQYKWCYNNLDQSKSSVRIENHLVYVNDNCDEIEGGWFSSGVKDINDYRSDKVVKGTALVPKVSKSVIYLWIEGLIWDDYGNFLEHNYTGENAQYLPRTFPVYLNSTAPTISTSGGSTTYATSRTITVSTTSSDVVKYSCDGGKSWEISGTSKSWSCVYTSDTVTQSVYVINKYGVKKSASVSVYVNASGPSIAISSGYNDSMGKHIHVNGNSLFIYASDASGVQSISYCISSTTSCSSYTTYDISSINIFEKTGDKSAFVNLREFSGTAGTSNYLFVQSVDGLGKTSTERFYIYYQNVESSSLNIKITNV